MTWRRGSCGPRKQGYNTAKTRRADGYVDMPLLPSEQARRVKDATRLALS